MEKELEQEYEKLADLEFEYNIISKMANDESERIIALGKMKRQLQKIRQMEKDILEKATEPVSNEQKDKNE